MGVVVSFASRLTHVVMIEEPGDTDADVDDYGQPLPGTPTYRTVRAAIQPKKAEEIALTTQAGAVVSDHRIYLLPISITTAAAIIHDAQDCPMRHDLPDARYEVTSVPDAAGLGHHLELEAQLIGGIAVAGS
jgi:hypothetical protein